MGNKKNAVKKRRVGKIIGILCACVAAALIIADIVIGNYMVSFAIGRNSVGETENRPLVTPLKRIVEMHPKTDFGYMPFNYFLKGENRKGFRLQPKA